MIFNVIWTLLLYRGAQINTGVFPFGDEAFASLNGGAPAFSVTSVQDNVDDRIFRRVTGTFTVPSYLTGDGSPGNRFNYGGNTGPDALPVRNGDFTAGQQAALSADQVDALKAAFTTAQVSWLSGL
mgnify:CR=1 FL=1